MTATHADRIIMLLEALVIQAGFVLALLLVIVFTTGRRR